MDAVLLLACSHCESRHPIFLALSMVAGTVPVAYLLLRPYTREIQTWGVPRMLLVVPTWPVMLVSHTVQNAVIGLPIWLLVHVGLRHAFPKPDGTAAPKERHAATPEIPSVVEQSDK